MGLWNFFSLVAGVATLGNSDNLYKSKMATADGGEESISEVSSVVWGQIQGQRSSSMSFLDY